MLGTLTHSLLRWFSRILRYKKVIKSKKNNFLETDAILEIQYCQVNLYEKTFEDCLKILRSKLSINVLNKIHVKNLDNIKSNCS